MVTAVRTGAAIFSSHHRLYFECKLLVFSNLTGATDTWVFTTQTSLGQHSLRSTLRRKKKKTNRRRTRALYSDATGSGLVAQYEVMLPYLRSCTLVE